VKDQSQRADDSVIDLQHARARLQSHSRKASPETLTRELEAIRDLLSQGLTTEARSRLTSLLTQARNHPALMAEARRSLSIALEMQGEYRESLEVIAMYEPPEARAKLDPAHFHLRKFRSTYATRMLRAGFDVRTVQHWMGHKSLETTMRYLAPAKDVHDRLDRVQIAGLLDSV